MRRSRAIRRWIAWTVAGEAAGFAIAATTAVFLTAAGASGGVEYVIIVLAGAAEGTALGLGQYRGMSSNRPPRARWVGATAAAAAFAWSLGMLPSRVDLGLDRASGITLIVVGGVALQLSIPVSQWASLRRRDVRAWIPVSLAAWLVGIAWTIAPSPFIDERSPLELVILLYVAAGVLMALTVAVITAPLAVRLWPPVTRVSSRRQEVRPGTITPPISPAK